ncbi:MAG: type VI secretion system-associated protein TagF [Burkholderiales bacterium]|nr:type VI secretion system-associated protein TagF [Burkholderiales bacterium]
MSGPIVSPEVAAPGITGWYGKIPSLGDFASRRLPQDFIGVWDAWLQHSIAASRASLGENWLDLYLNSPIWRFALMPGICGAGMWAGLLLPSVDRVGRHFPLTFALPLQANAETFKEVVSAHDWYAALEQLALSVLDIDFSVQDLENRLNEIVFPSASLTKPDDQVNQLSAWLATPSAAPCVLERSSLNSLAELFTSTAEHALMATGQGKSFWWSVPEQTEGISLQCFAGLPPEDHFASLLRGAIPAAHPVVATASLIADAKS